MAAGILPEVGTRYGPCLKGCEHRDCNETRRIAESPCAICGKPIGYDTRFYSVGVKFIYEHASCAEGAADRDASSLPAFPPTARTEE